MLDTDNQLRAHALRMWANHIETGDVTLSSTDAVQAKRPIKALSSEQMALAMRLRGLATQELAMDASLPAPR